MHDRRSSSNRRHLPIHTSIGRINSARFGDADGYLLFGVLILLFLFTLALSIAAPMVAKDIQRDKEEEAVQRGKQYKRAIRMYYKKFNAYPTTMAQLETTNSIRFLRKRYLDPITGKDDWRLIHVGEAKVPVLGFFGQPLQAGTSSATTGLMGNGTGGASNGSTIGGSSGAFGSSALGSSSGGFGSSSGTSSGDGTTPAAPVGVLPGMSAGAGTSGTTGSTDGSGSTGAPAGTTGGFGTSIASQSSTIGSGGSTGPIVGVGIALDKPSLVIYHKQEKYNKWEFTYDPIEEQMYVSSSGIPGASPVAGGTGTSGTTGTGSSIGFGSTGTSSGSGFGSTGTSSGTGSGSAPPAPTTPPTDNGSSNGSSPNPN